MKDTKEIALITQYKEEINKQLADKETLNSLMDITFKGLTPQLAKRAMLEGYMRGHTFADFLNKNVYAIPFRNNRTGEETYTLITSIDYARQKATDVVGKSAPLYETTEDGKILSCSVTIKRKVAGEIGEWTATVFFDEYTTGKNLWISKPRTMIAKVAEAHALRMAAPQELSKMYVEEEFDKERYNNAEKVSYQVVHKQEAFDREGIEEHTQVISTGSDTEEEQEVIVPKTDTERKALILKELKRIDPTLDVQDTKAINQMVADLTQLDMGAANYANIIYLLAKK